MNRDPPSSTAKVDPTKSFNMVAFQQQAIHLIQGAHHGAACDCPSDVTCHDQRLQCSLICVETLHSLGVLGSLRLVAAMEKHLKSFDIERNTPHLHASKHKPTQRWLLAVFKGGIFLMAFIDLEIHQWPLGFHQLIDRDQQQRHSKAPRVCIHACAYLSQQINMITVFHFQFSRVYDRINYRSSVHLK